MINTSWYTKIKKYKSDFIFVLLFSIFSLVYYSGVIDKGPLSTHVWRQTDCLSLTHHYAQGANFLSPEMHLQLGDNFTSGKTAGEFPVLYYIVGKLWNLFGESYLIYRVFYLFILFTGLYALYKSFTILFKDSYWAIAIALLIFTSPVYVFYGVSFLTDVPAMSFIFIALYFLIKYIQGKKKVQFFIAMLFFTLAGLIKISSLISFAFIGVIFFLELFPFKTLGYRKLFNHKLYEWLGFTLVLALIFSWYYYAHYFNSIHSFKYTFNNIYPLWLMNNHDISNLIKDIKYHVSQVFFSKTILYCLLFIFLINLMLIKKMPLLGFLSNIIITLGSIAYFILWAPLMGVHDYYYSALLILFIAIIIPFIYFVKSNHNEIFKSKIVKVFIGLILGFNFWYCYTINHLKTLQIENKPFPIVGNHEFVNYMTWLNWDIKTNLYRFERMKPYVKELGIKKTDKVISLPDPTLNATLYLLNQKGWTNFSNYNTSEQIDLLIQNGAKYLFISNPDLLNEEFLKPFMQNEIGGFEGVKIFKLSE